MFLYKYVKFRWIAPDPEILQHLHERYLSPPVVVHFVLSFSAILCGLFAAPAWLRGNWQRAISFTVALFVLGGLAAYIAGGESMQSR
jgi:hypothetical protein